MSKLLLIGGGHAHLTILRSLLNEPTPYEIVLISPNKYQYYSGMFSGFTEGLYNLDDIRINIEELCQAASVHFIEDTILAFDPVHKTVKGSSNHSYSFDVVSYDIGSNSSKLCIHNKINQIKPNYIFPNEINEFRSGDKPVIIGGGSAGVELALSTLAWRKQNNKEENITLISSSPLLASYGNNISQKIKRVALNKGLHFFENEVVEDINEDTIISDKKRLIDFSNIISLTGPTASKLFTDQDLISNSNGFLIVKDTLQHKQFPYIFGAGDCVTLENYPLLPKNGVYAVRQGPILWKNLKRYLNKQELLKFKPQKRFISILSTGDKEGLLTYGGFFSHGSTAWNIKQYIDKRFMNSHKL